MNHFLVSYLDTIDERLLEYLDDDEELRLDTVQRLRFYTSALLDGSITPAAVAEDWADWFHLAPAFVLAYGTEVLEKLALYRHRQDLHGIRQGGTLDQTISAVPVSGGNWSVLGSSVTALAPNAQYTVQVVQSDRAGNSGSGTSTFVIDTVAPTPTVTAPPTGSYTNVVKPPLSGTAGTATATSTTSADATTVTVKIFAGPTATGTALQTFTPTVSTGTWSVPGTALTALTGNAQYTVQVTQTDGAGNAGSGTSTFVIDTVAPTGLAVTGNSENGGSGTGTLHGTAGNVAASSTTSADSSTVTVKIFSGPNGTGTLLETDAGTRTGTTWTAPLCHAYSLVGKCNGHSDRRGG